MRECLMKYTCRPCGFHLVLRAVFFTIFILFLTARPVSAASSEYVSCTTEEDLALFFSVCRDAQLTSFSVQCGEELFQKLQENDFAGLHRQEMIAQIQTRKMYYYTDGRMEYQDVVYSQAPVSVCQSIADAEVAVLGYDLLGISDYLLVCTEDLFQTLFTEGYLFHIAARNGIENIKFLGYNDNHLEITDTSHFSLPYAYAKDGTAILDALRSFRDSQTADFVIVTDPSLLGKILEEEYRGLNRLLALGQVDHYRWNSRALAGILFFSETTFTDVPRILCASEEDMVQAIRQAGTGDITDFGMVISPELYASLTGNGKAPLDSLEKRAGLTHYEWRSCSSSLSTVTYTGAEIAAEVRQLSTLQEACSYMAECTARQDATIHLFCEDALYHELLEDGEWLSVGSGAQEGPRLTYLNDIISAEGIQNCTISKVSATCVITLYDIRYYPGRKILAALRSGSLDRLTPREQQAYQAAWDLAQQAVQAAYEPGARGQMQKAAFIHDSLCDRTAYLIDETSDEDDNAIGALLNGLANCDGYSDAFYLAASLAGLRVRYQYGDTWSGSSENAESTHLWNLVEIDGSWTAVDVTWDDEGEHGKPSCSWFLAGEDRMNRTHFWNRRTTVALAPYTDPALRPRREYIISRAEDLSDAAAGIAAEQPSCVEIYFAMGHGEDWYNELFQELHNRGIGNIRYLWNEEMGRLFLTMLEYY